MGRYDELTARAQAVQDTVERQRIAPSGERYARVWRQPLRPHEVPGYVAEVRKAAARAGITDLEIWRTEDSDGAVVTYGSNNFLNHVRITLGVHGDATGHWQHAESFDNEPSKQVQKWVEAAVALLGETGIPYELRCVGTSRVEFTFGTYANLSAFSLAEETGLIDRMAHGEDTRREFATLRNVLRTNTRPAP